MEALLSQIVSVAFHGTAFGMILYVISVGLSVTMGLMGFANLAHGVFAMAGGYILTSFMAQYGVPFPLALVCAFVLVALGSVVLERTLYARLYSAGELEQVLFTIGLIFISVAVARMIFGTLQQPVVLPDYLKGQFPLLGRDFPTYRVFIIAFSARNKFREPLVRKFRTWIVDRALDNFVVAALDQHVGHRVAQDFAF